MKDLVKRSIEIIKEGQAPSGAYIASPNFQNYAYSWFRDGAFIAYSMDLVGEHHSARRFHEWAAGVISSNFDVISRAIEVVDQTGKPSKTDFLHTRYTLDGQVDQGEWPNNQLDGIGTWLWALKAHLDLAGGDLPEYVLKSAELAVRYLSVLWQFPCSDCWEEFHDQIHTYTLAAIQAGIKAFSDLSGIDYQSVIDDIQETILNQCVKNGHFTKRLGSEDVDANLIALAVPYGVVDSGHPMMAATIKKIKEDLTGTEGLHRYAGDTFYGGGEWILLSAWLGWYWAEKGNKKRARELLSWIESQADEKGYLPEQVPDHLNKSEYYKIWVERWGKIANPLLWSHAKYLILKNILDQI